MNTKNTATKWIATGASMALAAGLGVAGLNFAGSQANAADENVITAPVKGVFSPAKTENGGQKYVYDADGHVTRMDYDMLNMHLRDPEWDFLNKKDAREGETATAHGRKFMFTKKVTLYKVDEIVRECKTCVGGFWAPINPHTGKIDTRFGAWGVAGKNTAEIGVGRLIYFDGTKWVNQSHFRVGYIEQTDGVTGYKVEGFREIQPRGFNSTVDGEYTGGWPSLTDFPDHQKLVSAAAYAFAHDSEADYAPFKSFVGKNDERRGDLILQLAFGSDIASAAEKVLVYKNKYAEIVEAVKNMVGKGFVTPGEAFSSELKAVKEADGKYHVTVGEVGNKYYPAEGGKVTVEYVKAEADKAGARSVFAVGETPDTNPSTGTGETTDNTTAAEPKPTESTTKPAEETTKPAEETTKPAAEAAPENKEYTLEELQKGITVEVPKGYKAIIKLVTDDVATPGAYVNRTEPTGTAIVAESGVTGHAEGTLELGEGATNVAPEPNPGNTEAPAPKPTAEPTAEPTAKPSPEPTETVTEKPAPKPAPTVTVTPSAKPAPTAAPSTAGKAPLAKTGASSMLVLLMAAGLATAGTGVVLARREA